MTEPLVTQTASVHERVRLSVADARRLAERAVGALGYDSEDSVVVAEHVIDAALCGYEYSGLPKILNVADATQSWESHTKPRIVHETPVSARMDGGNSVAMLAMARAAEVAIAKAKASGIAVVSLGNSWVSGRSAHYVEMLNREGLVALVMTSSTRKVAPYGGIRAQLGTNPIAIGVPTAEHPLIFDMGTAAFMASEVQFLARLGRLLPEGVAIDAQGQPSRNPQEVLERGALLPFGGHKGYGLALMIQALCFLDGSGGDDPQRSAYLVIALSPDLLMPAADYRREVTALIERIKATPRLPDTPEVRIPSERSLQQREINRHGGIEIDRSVHEALERLASGASR